MTLTTHRRWLALAAAALLSVVALSLGACGGDDDDDDGGSSDQQVLSGIQALDGTGLHEIEEQTLADGKAPGDAQNVARQSLTVLRLTTWPADLEDEAKALEKHFEEMDAALDGTDDKKIADSVGKAHDAWHEFSHMVWEHLQKQAGIEAGHSDDHAAAMSPTAVSTPTKAVAKLDISGAKVRATTTDVTGAYLTIKNLGAEDRLLKASADPAIAGMVQVHEMVADGATMKMQEVKAGIVVPASGELVLKPGGYHIMLMNLKQPLAAGQTVTLTLTFEKAGNMEVKAPVEDMTTTSGGSGMSGGMGGGMGATATATATMGSN